LRDLRDRALIATLTYSFARITAALKDLRPRGAGWTGPDIIADLAIDGREAWFHN
jgi:hypothetical protein